MGVIWFVRLPAVILSSVVLLRGGSTAADAWLEPHIYRLSDGQPARLCMFRSGGTYSYDSTHYYILELAIWDDGEIIWNGYNKLDRAVAYYSGRLSGERSQMFERFLSNVMHATRDGRQMEAGDYSRYIGGAHTVMSLKMGHAQVPLQWVSDHEGFKRLSLRNEGPKMVEFLLAWEVSRRWTTYFIPMEGETISPRYFYYSMEGKTFRIGRETGEETDGLNTYPDEGEEVQRTNSD